MPHDLRRVPDYLLERLAAGDLAADEQRDLTDRLARDESGAARLAALSEESEATLSRLPPSEVAAEVARRANPDVRSRPFWLLVPAVAAIALAVLVVRLDGPAVRPEAERDATTVKGLRPHLVIHRKIGAGEQRLAQGTAARAGELLQLGYVAAGSRFGAIVSIDGRGTVTRHWPAVGTTAGPLESRREVLLPESFRLDDAPAFERFILIAGDRPFSLPSVLAAAEALARRGDARDAPLQLDGSLVASSIVLTKESP